MLKGKFTILGIILFLFVSFSESKAQVHKIQASFIVNFFRYIQWPEINGNDFVVGVYGSGHEMYQELNEKIAGQRYRNTNIKVIEVSNIEDASACQILYLPVGKSYLNKKIIDVLKNSSTLIITEEQEWVPSHSVINFKVVDQKLTFSINQKNAQERQLAINSKLIALAR